MAKLKPMCTGAFTWRDMDQIKMKNIHDYANCTLKISGAQINMLQLPDQKIQITIRRISKEKVNKLIEYASGKIP